MSGLGAALGAVLSPPVAVLLPRESPDDPAPPLAPLVGAGLEPSLGGFSCMAGVAVGPASLLLCAGELSLVPASALLSCLSAVFEAALSPAFLLSLAAVGVTESAALLSCVSAAFDAVLSPPLLSAFAGAPFDEGAADGSALSAAGEGAGELLLGWSAWDSCAGFPELPLGEAGEPAVSLAAAGAGELSCCCCSCPGLAGVPLGLAGESALSPPAVSPALLSTGAGAPLEGVGEGSPLPPTAAGAEALSCCCVSCAGFSEPPLRPVAESALSPAATGAGELSCCCVSCAGFLAAPPLGEVKVFSVLLPPVPETGELLACWSFCCTGLAPLAPDCGGVVSVPAFAAPPPLGDTKGAVALSLPVSGGGADEPACSCMGIALGRGFDAPLPAVGDGSAAGGVLVGTVATGPGLEMTMAVADGFSWARVVVAEGSGLESTAAVVGRGFADDTDTGRWVVVGASVLLGEGEATSSATEEGCAAAGRLVCTGLLTVGVVGVAWTSASASDRTVAEGGGRVRAGRCVATAAGLVPCDEVAGRVAFDAEGGRAAAVVERAAGRLPCAGAVVAGLSASDRMVADGRGRTMTGRCVWVGVGSSTALVGDGRRMPFSFDAEGRAAAVVLGTAACCSDCTGAGLESTGPAVGRGRAAAEDEDCAGCSSCALALEGAAPFETDGRVGALGCCCCCCACVLTSAVLRGAGLEMTTAVGRGLTWVVVATAAGLLREGETPFEAEGRAAATAVVDSTAGRGG